MWAIMKCVSRPKTVSVTNIDIDIGNIGKGDIDPPLVTANAVKR